MRVGAPLELPLSYNTRHTANTILDSAQDTLDDALWINALDQCIADMVQLSRRSGFEKSKMCLLCCEQIKSVAQHTDQQGAFYEDPRKYEQLIRKHYEVPLNMLCALIGEPLCSMVVAYAFDC